MRPYQHYQLAEEFLVKMQEATTTEVMSLLTAQAQVHATLALVVEQEVTPDEKVPLVEACTHPNATAKRIDPSSEMGVVSCSDCGYSEIEKLDD